MIEFITANLRIILEVALGAVVGIVAWYGSLMRELGNQKSEIKKLKKDLDLIYKWKRAIESNEEMP